VSLPMSLTVSLLTVPRRKRSKSHAKNTAILRPETAGAGLNGGEAAVPADIDAAHLEIDNV
jgi:hypothetical protein